MFENYKTTQLLKQQGFLNKNLVNNKTRFEWSQVQLHWSKVMKGKTIILCPLFDPEHFLLVDDPSPIGTNSVVQKP